MTAPLSLRPNLRTCVRTPGKLLIVILIVILIGLLSVRADFIYVGNWGNNTIMKFDSHGKGTLFADSGLSQPQGLVFDTNGDLYVGNSGNDRIMKFDPTGHGTLFAHSGSPSGLVFDSAGNLFASDGAGSRIWKYD